MVFVVTFIYFLFQVIPRFLSKQVDEGGKPADVIAYISVKKASDSDDRSKCLQGQIRKCNLTSSKLATTIIIKEVRFYIACV